ncbi:MAG: hypothetical protein NW237_04415 [Cyanobacteriota bacterium]|nr:hypothetical protein [Cyanobacteriota bacterium]
MRKRLVQVAHNSTTLSPMKGKVVRLDAKYPLMLNELFLSVKFSYPPKLEQIKLYRLIEIDSYTKVEEARVEVIYFTSLALIQIQNVILLPTLSMIVELTENLGAFLGSPSQASEVLNLSLDFCPDLSPHFEATCSLMEYES